MRDGGHAKETRGVYAVALDDDHFAELVMAHAPPPPALESSTSASLARFPGLEKAMSARQQRSTWPHV
jgi:hypothetical protein